MCTLRLRIDAFFVWIIKSVKPMTQRLDWQTENLRFSFLGCTEAAGELVTWKSITGQEADSVTVKKAQGLRNEEGAWGGGQLTVTAHQGRVDVVLSPQQSPTSVEFPSLGELTIVADKLLDSLLRIKMPHSARLAVGARLNYRVPTPEEAIDALNQCVSFLSIDRHSHDVVFQENKTKKLKHSGLVLNRLFKWSQVRMQFIQVAVGSDGAQQVIQPSQSNFVYMLQLELDFNTAPNAILPHSDAYPALIKEIFEILKQDATSQRN